MIDLPMKAEVYCSDGIAGISTYVIGNPINQQVTHLVVKNLRPPFSEYVVPADMVKEITPQQIELKCTRDEMEKMQPFVEEEYIRTMIPTYLSLPSGSGTVVIQEEGMRFVPVQHRNIPEGELAIWRDAKVAATDGYVGRVDELQINPNNMQATHLVLLERHVFEQREITIPVSQIERVDEDTIYLKLDRQSIEKMATTHALRQQQDEQDKGHLDTGTLFL